MSPRHVAATIAAGLVAVALPACGATPLRDEPVVLSDVRNAWVVSGGTRRPAAAGEKLAKRDLVRTDADGTVTLVVRQRRVVLGGATDAVVPDGATVELVGTGALLVDRREGPGLTVRVGDTSIDNVGAGALRVERSLSVHIAGLSAGARVRTVTGQRLDLAPLYQVGVPGRSLPRTALPLQLRNDAWERAVVADLLADDDRLNDLARSIDAPGPPVVPVAYRRAAAARPSDLVLADAIGRAAARDEPGRRSAASRARLLRSEGGSWGVVARLLDTTAVDVGSALADVLRVGDPEAAAGSPTGAPAGTGNPVAGGSPQPGATPSPRPTGATRSPRPTQPPTSPPTSPPTETGSPDPLEQLISSIPTTPPPVLKTILPP